MPPDPKSTPPPSSSAPPPPGSAPPSNQGPNLEDRVNGLEAEQRRQGGMLEQILDRLPGRGQGQGQGQGGQAGQTAEGGKSVAELVREGIAELERDKEAKAKAEAADQARADHDARIKALEERAPAETAPTPVGAFRAAVQRYGFGIDQPGR